MCSRCGRLGLACVLFGMHDDVGAVERKPAPGWMAWWLRAAAVYNVVWGAAVVLFPAWTLGLLGIAVDAGDGSVIEGLLGMIGEASGETTGYSASSVLVVVWQCVGMIVGVYGVGYWVAARDVYRHWPIVLVGLLGKLFGPIGFVDAVVVRGVLPSSFGWTLLTNDLIWWVPFGLMLLGARRASRGGS